MSTAPPPSTPATSLGSLAIFRRLLVWLRPQYGKVTLGIVLLILAMPCELFPALVWKYVVDDLILKGQSTATPILPALFSFGGRLVSWQALLVSSLVWLFVVYAIGEALETLSGNVMNRVAQRFILVFRNHVYQKLQGQSLGYLQRQRTGDLMSRAMGDVDELQSFIVNGIDVILGEGMLWIATVVIVMLMDWRVASVSLAPLIIVYFLLRYFNKRVAPIYKAARDAAGQVSTRLQENLSGVVVIKIFGREKEEAARFQEVTNTFYQQQVRAINARALFFPFSRGVGFFSNVFMIGVGGYSILSGGSFTIGKLLAFRAYWWRLFGPIQTLARVNDMVQRASAAGRRVFEVLDAPDELPDADGAQAIQNVRGAMELRNVTFAYNADEPISNSLVADSLSSSSARTTGVPPVSSSAKNATQATGKMPVVPAEGNTRVVVHPVLHDISITIAPGSTVALCGPSGSGKSTVLNLLLRFYDPVTGSVTLDSIDLRSIRRDSLRRQFALVPQESFLFNDSIIDNIRYGHADATMEQVIAASRAANAHGFISRLPNGYDTRVGERGVRLSGGQKQRISIARAFLANPAVLLLDEPTSSVEPDSEAAIIAALDRLMTGRTTVLTSHRPSLISQADVVYVIEDGRVTATGSPDQLRDQGGWFTRFMNSTDDSGDEVSTESKVGE